VRKDHREQVRREKENTRTQKTKVGKDQVTVWSRKRLLGWQGFGERSLGKTRKVKNTLDISREGKGFPEKFWGGGKKRSQLRREKMLKL